MDTKLIYPLLMGFFFFFFFLSYKALRTVTYFSNSQKKDRNFNQKPFLKAWILSLSEVFVGILFYIQMKRSVRMNHAIGEDIQIVSQSLEILPGKRKLILLLKIIPVCLLDCVSLIIHIKRKQFFFLWTWLSGSADNSDCVAGCFLFKVSVL